MFRQLLQQEKLHSAIKWLLVIVIVVPMMFFGAMWVGSAWRTGPGGKAGEIFGRAVPWEDYQQEYQLISRSVQAQMGTVPAAFEPFLRQQTWDRLILKTEAKRTIRISDQQVARYIQTQPTFQINGVFSPELYYQFVRSMGVSPTVFEERVRDDLRLQQLTESVKTQVHVSDDEVQAAYATTHARRRIAYVAFLTDDFTASAEQGLTENDLRTFYAAHSDAVKTPVTRRIDYLGLSLAEALAHMPQQPSGEAELQSYLEGHQEEFAKSDGSLPALHEVRERVLDHWRADQARRRLTEVSLDLQDGVDAGMRFVELALATGLMIRTTPPISLPAADVPQGPTASMLRDAFDHPLGAMTRVSHEASGVFVLRSSEEVPSRVPPFEQVQAHVRRLAVQARAHDAAKTKAVAAHEQLTAQQHTAGVLDQKGWLALGLSPHAPAAFAREDTIEGLGHVPAVSEAVFALKPGEVSDVLETPQGFVVAVVEEQLPFDQSQYAKEKAAFRTQYLNDQQEARVSAWLSELRARARLKDLTAKN